MASPNNMEEKVNLDEIIDVEVTHFTTLTDEELAIEQKLRRKLDLRIMPVVISVYLMNYIDRSVISPTRLTSLIKFQL